MAAPRAAVLVSVVTLGVRPGFRVSALPPVRIFVGSEAGQHRAERVLVWSIERVRDPAREYRIHWLRDLAGFRRRRRRTGFSSYRYAVPELAGNLGRALYNDVDQVYLADPAEIFDAPLGEAGYLALAPRDTSVMLVDCERMAGVWTLQRAQRWSKRRLRAAASPAGFGPLPPEWNARDGEYAIGKTKCLHFTTLATQPWRPFPERFVYSDSPAAEVFHNLERSADAAGFQVFSRARPSPDYAPWLAEARTGTPPHAEFARRWDVRELLPTDPGAAPAGPPAPGAAACGVLDAAPVADLPWLLDELAGVATALVQVAVHCDARIRPARGLGVAARCARTPEWWEDHIDAAARRHPHLHWQFILDIQGGRREVRERGRHVRAQPPRVWVLADERPGCAAQARGLAAALGWPTETKRLAFNRCSALHNRLLGGSRIGLDPARSAPLSPPWPDLVIAAGRRTAPIACWIRARSGGETRTVLLGRKAGDAADACDLAVTPTTARLFPHPHRFATTLPLHPLAAEQLAAGARRWRAHFADRPQPRIGLLLGGRSGQFQLSAADAGQLGCELARLAADTGGSVLATTSRRTPAAAAAELRAALGTGAFFHRWDGGGDNPYLGILAWADVLVVTGDSESMLGEALAVGCPVAVVPLPARASFRWLREPREWVARIARAQRPSGRGTPRPQAGLAYAAARAIERGWVRPTRDLERLHAELVERGLVRRFGPSLASGSQPPLCEAATVAERVRALMGL